MKRGSIAIILPAMLTASGSAGVEGTQTVYQVKDSPRQGAVGAWRHDKGVSQWMSLEEIRPLLQRDMTTRKDYDAVLALNRHVIAPFGWMQEADNSKLVMRGNRYALAREVDVNTYRPATDVPAKGGDGYWNATKDFRAGVRADWARLEKTSPGFALTVQGEPEQIYVPILDPPDEVQAGMKTTAAALAEAGSAIAQFTAGDVEPLEKRIGA